MRPFLIWRDDWLLGFQAMDEQHLAVANAMNELHGYLVSNDNKPSAGMEQLCQRLTRLLGMVREHINDEEALMQTYEYAGLPEHHREHALLLAEMQELIREIQSGRRPFTLQTLTALKYWQIDHVLYSDRKFADYLMCQMQLEQEDTSFGKLAGWAS
ncbi:MAG: hemerythrin domain-containing protein [Chromatiales bacterium]|jgi:hemerythrin